MNIKCQWQLSMDADKGQVIIVRVVSSPLGSLQLLSFTDQACDARPAASAMSLSHQDSKVRRSPHQ